MGMLLALSPGSPVPASLQSSLLRGTVMTKDGGTGRRMIEVWYLCGDFVSTVSLLDGRETSPVPCGAGKGPFWVKIQR